MNFITQWNLKTIISILTFTFYIVDQICIIILYQIRLVFLIFEIKYCLMEVLAQPGAMTFWVPPQYQVSAGPVILRKYTPWNLLL